MNLGLVRDDVDIILGLLESQKGTLEIDEKVITKQNSRSWQRSIGYVPQHIYLSDDTVAANIAFGIEAKDIDLVAVEKAAKIANLHKFLINYIMKKVNIKDKKFLVKLFIKLARKLGFEIIDQNNLTLPTNEKNLNDNLNVLNSKSISLPLGEVKITRNIESLLIIFRSFTNEDKLLSQNKKRLFEKDKKEYTLRSLQSICKNIIKIQEEMKNINIFLIVTNMTNSNEFDGILYILINLFLNS